MDTHRGSGIQQSSTLYVDLGVHKESVAVTYVSDAKDAEVLYSRRYQDPPR
jgi:hypothetical protein